MPRDDSNPVRNVLQPVAAPMPPPMAAPMSTAMPTPTGRMYFDSVFEVLKASFLFPKFGINNWMLHCPFSYLSEIWKKYALFRCVPMSLNVMHKITSICIIRYRC